MLGVAGCCGNPGGTWVLVATGVEVVSAAGGAGIAVGCASIPSVELGMTSFEARMLCSGGCTVSSVSSSSGGAVGVSSSGAEGPGGVSPGLWLGRAHQRLGITDGWSTLLDLIWIVRI